MYHQKLVGIVFFSVLSLSLASQVRPVQTIRPSGRTTPVSVAPGNKANASLATVHSAADQLNRWIEVYELPEYKGRMVRFKQAVSGAPLRLPFTPDRISIRRCNNITLRIKMHEMSSPVITEIKEDIPNIRINNGGIQGFSFEDLPYIEIFEFPDYRGRSVKLVENVPFKENLGLPFPVNHISVKLSSDQVIAFLSGYCGNGNGYTTIDRTMRSLNISNRVCGLELGKKNAVRMRFNGFLSEIHNNDCKRMYGTVQIRLLQKDAAGNTVSVCKTFDESRMDANGWVTIYHVSKSASAVPANLFDINRYFIADRDTDVTGRKNTSKGRLFRTPLNEDRPYELFYFDSLAFQRGNIRMQVKTNIGSHHKGCDLCTDFTDNATMTADAVQEFTVKNYPRYENFIQAGRFRTKDGTGAFTGPEHATYLDFSFTQVGYSGYRTIIPYR